MTATPPDPQAAPQPPPPQHPFSVHPGDPQPGFTTVSTSVMLAMGPDGSKRAILRVAKSDSIDLIALDLEHAMRLAADLIGTVEGAGGIPAPSRLVVAQPQAVADALADLQRGAPNGNRPPV